MSNEHVWPEWLGKLLPPGAAGASHSYAFEDAKRGEYRRLEGMRPHDITVRDVCEPCNTGWMHRSEDSAGLIVPRMVARETRLSEFDQAKLAYWGVLKGLVAVRVGTDGPILGIPPPEDYRRIYESRDSQMCTDGFLVYAATASWSDNRAPAGFFRLVGIGRESRKEGDKFDGYALTFTALDLVVMVIRLFGAKPTRFVPFDDQKFETIIRRIWPVQPGGVDWPPRVRLTKQGLISLSGGAMKP